MRQEDTRMVKAATLGWLEELERWPKVPGKKRKTLLYWKGLLREAEIDYTRIGKLMEDRKQWKQTVRERMKHVEEWEKKGGKETLQERGDRRSPTPEVSTLVCDYEGCGKVCKSKAGLTNHIKRMHERSEDKKVFKCERCQESFDQEANLINHRKVCTGESAADDTMRKCNFCGKEVKKGNFRRHYRTHNIGEPPQLQQQPATARVYVSVRQICDQCGIEKDRSNMARHKRVCPGGGGAVL